MTSVPLGKGAYERLYAGAPLVELMNRWLEANPANLREGTSVLARPGTTQLAALSQGTYTAQGPMRGNYALQGLFNNSLFVVCGTNLYEISENLTITQISGTINGTGTPEVAWQAGIGYQRLWISDGVTLQYYGGLSGSSGVLNISIVSATGTLTKIGTIADSVDTFEIGGVYYVWSNIVNTVGSGSVPIGTAAKPYVINPTNTSNVLDPLNQLVKTINFTGIGGVDYSNSITSANPSVTAASNGTVPATSVVFTAGSPGPAGANISFAVTHGSALSASGSGNLVYSGFTPGVDTFEVGGVYYTWGSTFTSSDAGTSSHPYIVNPVPVGGGWDPLNQLILAITETGTSGIDYSTTLTLPNAFVTATNTDLDLSTGYAISPSTNITLTAITPGTSGNSITFTVTAGSALTASGSGVLVNGGLNALQVCAIPGNVAPLSLTQVSSYVLVSVSGTNQFFWVNPGATLIGALDFASKESSPDPIICMRAVGDQVMIMGSKSTENWYATGNLNAPFAPIEGRVYARGVVAGTPVVVDDGIVVVGDDGRVYNIGFQPGDSTDVPWGVNRISNNGIEERIRYQNRRLNPV